MAFIYTQRGYYASVQTCVESEPVPTHYRGMSAAYRATDLRSIGERLTQTREALDMSQADFARFTGITTQSLSNYETGTRRPQLDQAFVIVQKTGVTLDWIYFGDRSGLPLRIASKLPSDELRKVAS